MIKCIAEIMQAAKGAITKKEAQDIIREIEKRFNAKMPKEDVNLGRRMDIKDDPASMSTQERMVLAAEEAFQAKAKENKETVRRANLQVQVQNAAQVSVARLGHGTKGVQEFLMRDVAAKARGIEETLMAELYQGLEPYMTATGHKMTDAQQLEVLQHIMDPNLLKKQFNPETGTPAEVLARAFRSIEDTVHARKNSAGADIAYIPGHFPQSWDANATRWFGLDFSEKLSFRPKWLAGDGRTIERMREKAKTAWADEMMNRVDRERYLDDSTGQPLNDEQLHLVLEGIWNTIASHGLSGLDPSAVGGEASLAKQLAAHRELHFKTAEDFLWANKEFGSRDLFTSMTANVRRHANEISMLEALGPNPDGGFKNVLAYGKQFGAEKSTFGREGSTLAEMMFNELTGRTNAIAEDKFDLISRTMQGARNMITSAKLGMLPASQIVDLATFHVIARSDGLGMGEGIRAITAMFNPMNGADRALARKHGLLASMVINDVALRYGDSKGAGWTSKAADATVTWSGAKFWTDALRQAFQVLVGSHVAEARELAFGELDPQFRNMLERNQIDSAAWDIIRRAETAPIGGMDIVTPWTVKQAITAEMDATASITGSAGARAGSMAETNRLHAAERLAALMAEESEVAVLHPSLKDKAYVKWGTRPGEIPGEFMRSIFLFKTFSVATVTRLLPRITSSEFGPARTRAEVGAQLLLGMMVTGALAVQLKEIWKGKNPRDMSDPKFWGAAFMQAGGVGIFGDFAFADANRFGGGFVSTLGGPVAGMVQDVQKLTMGNAQQAIDGKHHRLDGASDFAADSMQFVKNYAPMMNLWYTRLALDHLLFFQAQEAVNPGYLQRMKRRTETENKQTWWWSPTDGAPESGPNLGAAVGAD